MLLAGAGMVTLTLLVVLFTLAWRWHRNKCKYWEELGVYCPPAVFCLGHMLYLMNIGDMIWDYHEKIYKKVADAKMYGLYEAALKPILCIKDPKLIQMVLLKDFDHFVDRRPAIGTGVGMEVFRHMLINLEGNEWKETRSIMTPTFTSGKMKNMFYLIQEKAEYLVKHCKLKCPEDKPFDMGDLFSKYTLDVIASCGFGLEINSLNDENSQFMKSVKTLPKFSFLKVLQVILWLLLPKRVTKYFRVSLGLASFDYLINTVKHVIKFRETGTRRGDFLDLMLDARRSIEEENHSGKAKKTLSEESIVAQSVLFIIAGYDTTANTLCFAILLLAKHPKYQELLRAELIERMKLNEDGDLSYHDIMESKYLEGILAETLRLYPAGHTMERKCTKDYFVPGTSVTVKKDQMVQLPVWALHHDEKYFKNATEFRPERFFPENKHSILSGTYLPFGLGPRMCIATRFAQMEAKLVLAKLVLNFNISPAPGFEDIKLSNVIGVLRPKQDTVQIIMKEIDQNVEKQFQKCIGEKQFQKCIGEKQFQKCIGEISPKFFE